MKELEEMTLEELKEVGKEKDIEEYFNILMELQDNRLSKKVIENLKGEPIDKIYRELMKAEEEVRSHSLFPGSLVVVYPNIKEMRSKSFKICDFSGAVISPGSIYASYRPLFENMTTNERYILSRTIKVEIGYRNELPTNIHELEALEQNMFLETFNNGIDFNHFSIQMGGQITLQKLKKERRKVYAKNRNSK